MNCELVTVKPTHWMPLPDLPSNVPVYLHHPDVPYHGTEKGDSEELWRRRVIAAALAPIISAEREACAKVCDAGVKNAEDWDSSYWDQACENRAVAIRTRSNVEGNRPPRDAVKET